MTASFKLVDDTLLERFELRCLRLRVPGGDIVTAPVIDGWLQIDQPVTRIPHADEEVAFYAALKSLIIQLRTALPDLRWFLLHKSPGLKLRFAIRHQAEAAVIAIAAATEWAGEWLGTPEFAAFFDQAELRPLSHRAHCDDLLTRAADALLAGQGARTATTAEWADAVATLMVRTYRDQWIGHDALARFARLRTHREDAVAMPLLNPSGLVAAWPDALDPGFMASVAFLQTFNLILNMWAVPEGDQASICAAALAALRPELAE